MTVRVLNHELYPMRFSRTLDLFTPSNPQIHGQSVLSHALESALGVSFLTNWHFFDRSLILWSNGTYNTHFSAHPGGGILFLGAFSTFSGACQIQILITLQPLDSDALEAKLFIRSLFRGALHRHARQLKQRH